MGMKWTDHLSNDVDARLSACRTIKADLLPLTQAKWNHLKNRSGFEKEDALVSVLELLDCNGCCFDLTTDEYNEILHRVV